MRTKIARAPAPRLLAPRLMAALLAALLLSACAAPAFQQPAIDTPAAFKEAAGEVRTAADGSRWSVARHAEQQPRGQWWLAFQDPGLNQLVDEATRNNASLAVAAARVKQARSIAGIAQAERMPQVGVGVQAQRARPAPLERNLAPGTGTTPTNSYSASVSASYELDLFGRVGAGVAAARQDAGAVEAAYRSVLLSLQADVAQTWFRLRALDAELATVDAALRLREESVRINGRRFELGDIGEFDLARAKTELSATRAEAIGLQRQRTHAEHALAVLLGRPAARFTAGTSALPEGVTLPAIPAGLPSALLERRPDIAAAQRAMEAAHARIGVARAAMFPALTINALGGGVGGTMADVFQWSSRSWVLGALLSLPVIDGGRNKANVARSEAVLEESVAAYRERVLAAFAEVEDNLAGVRILAEQGAQLEDAVRSARRSAQLARKLYDAGRSSYLDLLDAQRNLAASERSVVQLRGNQAMTTVALIRALGGGWDAPAPAMAPLAAR